MSIEQDGWQVQVRRRLKGKNAGQMYKVWISPQGVQHWSFGKAENHGFKDPENKVAAIMKNLSKDKKAVQPKKAPEPKQEAKKPAKKGKKKK